MTTDQTQAQLRKMAQAIKALKAQKESLEGALRKATSEPIAIVGLDCHLPAGGLGPEAFLDGLTQGRDGVVFIPEDRWDRDLWYDPDPDTPGRSHCREGGFIDHADCFDAAFFGMSPREAATLDPQHRLLLQTAWHALEDAGYAPDRLRTSRTGVYVGISSADYAQLLRSQGLINAYYLTGNPLNAASGRIAHTLGLHGPALSVDTACSSSLVAVHTAVTALRAGDCDLALAGGVNLMVVPDGGVILSKAGMIAPDGRCKTFDSGANGYGRGEGCGLVVLKRLSDAEAAGDRIRAVILASASTQDGPSSGFTVPNGMAQRAAISAAVAASGHKPAEIDYAELHGTGTPLGDPIEVNALAAAYGPDRPADRPLLLGAVKSNIGHLESAAGVAGLIKTTLCLETGQLPANLHLKTPNPDIAWDRLPVAPVRENRPWPDAPTPDGEAVTARPRLAGVSSFGASGTNVHLVVGSAPQPGGDGPAAGSDGPDGRLPQPLCLSSATPSGLQRLALAWAERLRADTPAQASRRMARWTLAGSALEYRLGVYLPPEHTAAALRAFAESDVKIPTLADGVWMGRLPPEGAPLAAIVAAEPGSTAVTTLSDALDGAEVIAAAADMDVGAVLSQTGAGVLIGFGAETALGAHDAVIHADSGIAAAVRLHAMGASPDWLRICPEARAYPERPPRLPFALDRHWLPDLPVPEEEPLDPAGAIAQQPAATGDGTDTAAALAAALARLPADDPAAHLLRRQLESAHRVVQTVVHRQLAHLRVVGAPEPAEPASCEPPSDTQPPMTAATSGQPVDRDWVPILLWGADALALEAEIAALAQDPQGFVTARRGQLPPADHSGPAAVLVARDGAHAAEVLADPKTARTHLLRGERPQVAPKLAFLFPGLGDHYLGMGKELAEWAPDGYGAVFQRSAGHAAAVLGENPAECAFAEDEAQTADAPAKPMDLRAMMAAARGETVSAESPAQAALNRTPMAHGAILACELALLEQLSDWGVRPDVVMGYSLGEYAAAVAAGVLSATDAMALAARRAALLDRVGVAGGMLAVPVSEEALGPHLQGSGCALAVQAAPNQSVVAGPSDALDTLAGTLRAAGILSRKLTARMAFHTPHLGPIDAPLAEILQSLSLRAPAPDGPALISTLTGATESDRLVDPHHWVSHTVAPVRFADGVGAAYALGVSAFLEVGPGRGLTGFVHQHPGQPAGSEGAGAGSVTAVSCLRGGEEQLPDPQVLLQAVAKLWLAGVSVDWSGVCSASGAADGNEVVQRSVTTQEVA